MILTKEELMNKLKSLVGDKDDNETLSFIEDCNDTLESLDNNELKNKYDEAIKNIEKIDKEWRKKYRDRFFNDDIKEDSEKPKEDSEKSKEDEEDEENLIEKANSIRFDDLFKSEKE